MTMRRWITTAMATAGLVSLMAAPAAAFDPGGFQVVQAGGSSTPDGGLAGRVLCPAGTRAIGAGARNGDLSGMFIEANDGAVWAGSVQRSGDPGLVVQAVCAPNGQVVRSTRIDATLPQPGPLLSANLTCPTGTTPYGGGGEVVSSTNHHVVSAFVYADAPTADGRGWFFRAAAVYANLKLLASLRCIAPAPPPLGLLQSTVSVTQTAVAVGLAAATRAVCPAGAKPVSGGAWWTRPTGELESSGRLTMSDSDSDAWAGAGRAPNGSVLHVSALCANAVQVVVIHL